MHDGEGGLTRGRVGGKLKGDRRLGVHRWLDGKFRRIPGHYVVQCLLAGVATAIVLVLMDTVAETALIASLGSSVFIAFTMPHAHVSRTRYLLGGYIVGTAVGIAFGLLLGSLDLPVEGLGYDVALIGLGAGSVAVSIFLMVLTNTEHPPAAGIALGLVLNRNWGLRTLAVILGAIAALALVKWLLRRYLKNLL
jgi:CBS-domain-containing membrane protein